MREWHAKSSHPKPCYACCRLTSTSVACAPPQEFGIKANDIKKLQEGGIHTVEALAHISRKVRP